MKVGTYSPTDVLKRGDLVTKPATRSASASRSASATRSVKGASGSGPAGDGDAAPRRRRLTAEARKSSILAAARRAFSETGDMNGTTIKLIAERSGISEGVIYRHFESKDQLFFEAIVEPLTEAVERLVAAA